jgi:hypothetical protein
MLESSLGSCSQGAASLIAVSAPDVCKRHLPLDARRSPAAENFQVSVGHVRFFQYLFLRGSPVATGCPCLPAYVPGWCASACRRLHAGRDTSKPATAGIACIYHNDHSASKLDTGPVVLLKRFSTVALELMTLVELIAACRRHVASKTFSNHRESGNDRNSMWFFPSLFCSSTRLDHVATRKRFSPQAIAQFCTHALNKCS